MATQKGRNWSSGDIVTAANLSSIERGVSAVAEEYTPTTWANGNTVTAASLNNIEQGIANAGGGSSDFSTATVTVVTNDSFRLSNSVIIDETDDAMITNIFFESGDYPLVLYKGEYEGNIQAPDEMSITSATGSGDVSIGTTPFGYSVTITGDGTLNVTVE